MVNEEPKINIITKLDKEVHDEIESSIKKYILKLISEGKKNEECNHCSVYYTEDDAFELTVKYDKNNNEFICIAMEY